MSKKNEPAKSAEEQLGEIAETLTQVRRLMVFSLVRNGASQEQVAGALGVAQQTVSRMMAKPKGSKKAGG